MWKHFFLKKLLKNDNQCFYYNFFGGFSLLHKEAGGGYTFYQQNCKMFSKEFTNKI